MSEKLPEFGGTKSESKIVSEVGGAANLKLNESIARNMKFNQDLALQQSGRTIEEITAPIRITRPDVKLARIEQVLKDKGMDSQQRSQAMELISSILSE